MAKHNEFGKKGEQLAVDYLTENGYKVIHRNYRYLKAEIDIIARKGDILAIVEVKSRSSDYMQPIADTVTYQMRNKLSWSWRPTIILLARILMLRLGSILLPYIEVGQNFL